MKIKKVKQSINFNMFVKSENIGFTIDTLKNLIIKVRMIVFYYRSILRSIIQFNLKNKILKPDGFFVSDNNLDDTLIRMNKNAEQKRGKFIDVIVLETFRGRHAEQVQINSPSHHVYKKSFLILI